MTIPGKHTVLIVDDEPSIRDNLERLLKTSGYEPVVAADGREALEKAAEQDFEVVLLDIRMPGLSGLDVLRKLHADHPDTSVIMVTAVADLETAVGAMKEGAYDYVTKPLNLDDILMRVEKARERRCLALLVKDYQKNLEERLEQQARDLREMMEQTVQALVREEMLARELEAKGGKRRGTQGAADIKGFAENVLRRLRGSVS